MVTTLIGIWMASGLIYQGHTIPMPNPDLKIFYTFDDTGINVMHYYRENESGTCTRKAVYEFSNNTLKQKVVWTSPNNAHWCDQDVDMQLNYESWATAKIVDNNFHLYAKMGDEDLIFIFKSTEGVDLSP